MRVLTSAKITKTVVTLALFASLGITLPAFAQVTLNVGDNVIVTAINGQEIKTGLFSQPTRKFNLEAGKHVITAKYTRFYNLHGDNHDILRSSNISVPVELADNQNYDLVMVGQPEDYSDAKDYVKKPTLAVMQNGQVLASQQATDNGGTGIFSGLGNALGGMFGGGSKAVQANQQAISALNSNENKSSTTIPAIAPTGNAVVTTSTDTLDQFMQLWLKASPAEREKMRTWMQK